MTPAKMNFGAINVIIDHQTDPIEDKWNMQIYIKIDEDLHTTNENINDSIYTIRMLKDILETQMLSEMEEKQAIEKGTKEQVTSQFDVLINELKELKTQKP